MKNLKPAAGWLVIVGGLNWGLIGLGSLLGAGNWNVVNLVLGSIPSISTVENVLYVLVGLSAAWKLSDKLGK